MSMIERNEHDVMVSTVQYEIDGIRIKGLLTNDYKIDLKVTNGEDEYAISLEELVTIFLNESGAAIPEDGNSTSDEGIHMNLSESIGMRLHAIVTDDFSRTITIKHRQYANEQEMALGQPMFIIGRYSPEAFFQVLQNYHIGLENINNE